MLGRWIKSISSGKSVIVCRYQQLALLSWDGEFCTIEALCFRSQPECAPFVSLPCLSSIQRNETLQMFIHYGLCVLYYVFYAILYQSPAKASLHWVMQEIAFGAVFAFNLVASFVCAKFVDRASWNVGVFKDNCYVGEKPKARLQEALGTLAHILARANKLINACFAREKYQTVLSALISAGAA